jgi:hypothetical protein
MSTHSKQCRCRPAIFAMLYPQMARVARRYGYALTVHGSMRRDFDVVAVPWVSWAKPGRHLARALADSLGGYCAHESVKPHGRVAILIHYPGGGYIDFGFTPRHSR